MAEEQNRRNAREPRREEFAWDQKDMIRMLPQKGVAGLGQGVSMRVLAILMCLGFMET